MPAHDREFLIPLPELSNSGCRPGKAGGSPPLTLEIDEIKTVPQVPRFHPFVERLIGTTRREFLDPVLFWHARDLERTLGDFQASDNEVRSHASLKGHTPSTFAGGQMVARAELNNVRWVSHCRDLVQLPVAG